MFLKRFRNFEARGPVLPRCWRQRHAITSRQRNEFFVVAQHARRGREHVSGELVQRSFCSLIRLGNRRVDEGHVISSEIVVSVRIGFST